MSGSGVDRAAPRLLRSGCPRFGIDAEGRSPMTPASFARPLALVALVVLALAPAAGVGAGQAAPAAPAAPVAGTVVGSPGVNIRSCARVECSVKAVAKLGEALLVTGKQVGGFYPVDWGGLTGFAYHLYVATPETGAPELRLGAPGCKRVALIFNVGIGYETRLDVLDALKAEGVPATVFPMGWWAAQHPDLLKRIADGQGATHQRLPFPAAGPAPGDELKRVESLHLARDAQLFLLADK